MEMREAKTAKVQAKADPGKKPEEVKELMHLAAAVLITIKSLKEE